MFTAIQRLRVEWAHCDPAEIIYNPNYYIWMDQGTHRLLEAANIDMRPTEENPRSRGFPLVSSGMDFTYPARFRDVVKLESRISKIGTKSFRVEHRFTLGDRLLAEGFEIRVWGASAPDDTDRLIALPLSDSLKAKLAQDVRVDVTLP